MRPSSKTSWPHRKRRSAFSRPSGRPLPIDREIATGWMDITFRVEEAFRNAVVRELLESTGDRRSGRTAAELTISWGENDRHDLVLLEDDPQTLSTPAGSLTVALGPKRTSLPFSLQLGDF